MTIKSRLLSSDETSYFRRLVTSGLNKRKILRVVTFDHYAVATTIAGYERGRTPSSITIFACYPGLSGTCWSAIDAVFLDAGICPDPTDVGVSFVRSKGQSLLRFVMRSKRDGYWIAYGVAVNTLDHKVKYMLRLPESAIVDMDEGRVDSFHWLLRQRQMPGFFETILAKIKNVTHAAFLAN